DRLKRIADDQKKQTADALLKVENVLYFQRINRAEQERRATDFLAAQSLLEECPEALRDWEWSYLYGLTALPRSTNTKHKEFVTGLAFSADGQTLASASVDRTVRLYETHPFRLKSAVLAGDGEEVLDVAASPDGRQLATANKDGTVSLWDI